MDTSQALDQLCIQDSVFSQQQRQHLDQKGYVILSNLFPNSECRAWGTEFDRLVRLEGDTAGQEVHREMGATRLSNLFNKTTVFDECLKSGPILKAAQHLLGEIKLHGANIREPLQGYGHQGLHSDVPKLNQKDWHAINAIIALDDTGPNNGAPRIVPNSHLWAPIISYPLVTDIVYEDETPEDRARLPTDREASYPGELVVTLPVGSAILINAALWHGGTQNQTGERRRLLHLTFTRRSLPQQIVQQQVLTNALEARLTPALAYLLDVTPTPTSTDKWPRGTHA